MGKLSPLKIYRLLPILFICLFACKKQKVTSHPQEDINLKKAEQLFANQNDSAFYYFNIAATTSKDSLTIATSYSFMAQIQNSAGDFFGAQESATRSLKLINIKNPKHATCWASSYNELGRSSLDLKQYQLAFSYFNMALKHADDDARPVILSNKAMALQKLKQYPQSAKIYNELLLQKTKNSTQYARFLSNAAKTMWMGNASYNAAPLLLKALNIRIKNKDNWGLNASYAHLADYYTPSRPDSALLYAKNMYQIAQKLNSADDQLEALQKLISLSPSAAVKKYFESYQRLSDSLQTARNAAKNQFAIVRYESEKSKADNLILQKENTEKRYQIIKRDVILVLGILSFIAISVIAFLWFKKRQQKMELEKQHAVQENQLKTSKKVHDVVANGLYRIMSEMENQPDIDRELIIDKIENLYEKSRDISYDKPELHQQQFNEKLSVLLTSFATSKTKVIIVGNKAALWENVNAKTQYELEHILQELMVNMKKHSEADTVVIKFEEEENNILISYTDNGIGIADDKNFNNGLNNTVSRIDAIGGTVNFETKLEKGLKVHISFPVA
ncbi:two-component sensor histidine kinase [Pedobacter agri]|nr:two-component sensor histidine kinase [Pedobacter agri]